MLALPPVWVPAVTAYKISILLVYQSIWEPHQAFRLVTYFLMGLCVCYGISISLAGLFICFPLSALLKPVLTGTYANWMLFYILIASINGVIDFQFSITYPDVVAATGQMPGHLFSICQTSANPNRPLLPKRFS